MVAVAPATTKRPVSAVLHAIINGLLGLCFSAAFPLFGPQLYRFMGGQTGSLDAALRCSNVVFEANVLVRLPNALASSIRGTGNMLVRSVAICMGVVLLISLLPLLIFG